MTEKEKVTAKELAAAAKELTKDQTAYLRGVVDGMRASKAKEDTK